MVEALISLPTSGVRRPRLQRLRNGGSAMYGNASKLGVCPSPKGALQLRRAFDRVCVRASTAQNNNPNDDDQSCLAPAPTRDLADSTLEIDVIGTLDPTATKEKIERFVATTFLILLGIGIVAAALALFLTSNMDFKSAVWKMCRRLQKSVAARQTLAIVVTMLFVRSGLVPVVKFVRSFFQFRSPWETSTEAYLLKEIYKPLELLLGVAACATLVENILPPLISVPKHLLRHVMRTVLSLTFILSASRVGFTVKKRILQEAKWRMELKEESGEQRRIEGLEKLTSVGIVVVTSVLGMQAVGLDINSLLAIGGIGGLAIGLAGREIFENVFSGFLIMGARPFDEGDEVLFSPGGKLVEGIVVDIGWYHTSIRSFEREMYNIPNSVFSREVVLNVTRKGKEWRFSESIPIRVCDLDKVEAIVSDLRRMLRQDEKVIQRLYRRVFLEKITREYITILIAFYVEVPNRDAYLAVRQNMYMAFVACIQRNGAKIAEKKLKVDIGMYSNSRQLYDDPNQPPTTAPASGPMNQGLVHTPETIDLTLGLSMDDSFGLDSHSGYPKHVPEESSFGNIPPHHQA